MLENIINWCNDNQGFFFVILTTIYIIATVLIYIANYKSAKASREQTAEQQRQFEEINRPQIDVSIEVIRNGLTTIKIENTGKRYARNVQVILNKEFIEQISDKDEAERLIKLSETSYNLGINEKWYACVCVCHKMHMLGKVPLVAIVSYTSNDCDKNFTETFTIDFSQYTWMLLYNSPLDEIQKHQNIQAEALKKIALEFEYIKKYIHEQK